MNLRRSLAAALLFLTALCVPSQSATQKWVGGYYSATGGAGNQWTSVCSSELNSLPGNDAILCGTVISNQTNQDLSGMLSFTFGSTTTQGGSPYLSVFIYPLNEDNSTYGDGNYASFAGGPPPAQYATNCIIPAPASATSAFKGECGPFPLPPVAFKFVIFSNLNTNASGDDAAASGNVVYLNTSNFVISKLQRARNWLASLLTYWPYYV